MRKTKSIIMLIPYFGKWPEWFDLYLESCRCNASINWVFFTNCELPNQHPDNVLFVEYSFDAYKNKVSSILGINFNPASPYKLCDIKPALGFIHADMLQGFDYFGFGDIDVIYGNIRKFYTEEVLKYNCLSTHWDRLSGHFCLFKNTVLNREAFFKIKDWRVLFEDPNHLGVDESKFSKIYLRHKKFPHWLRKIYGYHDYYQRSCYFKEQYSTILFPEPWLDGTMDHPQVWYWHNGRLTNNKDKNREFLYLHFMNWKSNRWLRKMWGQKAAWADIQIINHVPENKKSQAWSISRKGFYPLEEADKKTNFRGSQP